MLSSFDDVGFSQLLNLKTTNQNYKVLLFANKFYGKLYLANDGASDWRELGVGEIGDQTREVLKKFTRSRGLFFITTEEKDLSEVHPDFSQAQLISKISLFDNWLKESKDLTTGRKGEVSEATKFKVACAAAWRCQFYGCGEDLR